MDLQGAVEALMAGKKVRLKGWEKESYLKQSDKNEINYYHKVLELYRYDFNILQTNDWIEVGNDEETYSFPAMVMLLRKGKKFKQKSWISDDYLEYDSIAREIVRCSVKMLHTPILNTDALASTDWEIME